MRNINLLYVPLCISSSSCFRKASMARRHSTSIGFPTLFEYSSAEVPSSLKSSSADKLRIISLRRCSGVVPLVSGNQSTTKIIVANSTVAKGTNEKGPRNSCRYGNTSPTTKLHAQFSWQDTLTDCFDERRVGQCERETSA